MATEAKTTRVDMLRHLRVHCPDGDGAWAFAVEFLCNEFDAAHRRIAELDAQLREMARGKR